MTLPFPVRDCFGRALSRKTMLIIFAVCFLVVAILGMSISTPAFYDYHLTLCERFVSRVCYSQRSVILIFLERFAGNMLFLALMIASGIHVAALAIPPVVLAYRAYTFGGSIAVFFSVYQLSGALIVFALYLPIHILVDAVLLVSVSLSCARAPRFRFCKEDFKEMLYDFLVLLALIAIICLLEMILLLVLFHPLGNLL